MNPNLTLFAPLAGYWLAAISFLLQSPSAFFFFGTAPLLVLAAVLAVVAYRRELRP